MECGAQSLVDLESLNEIQAEAEKAKNAALNGDWKNSTMYWASTEWIVIDSTHGVDFYNIHKFDDYWSNISLLDKPELQLMLSAGRSQSKKMGFSAHLTLLDLTLAVDVCLSVRLSNACIVTKLNNSLSIYQRRTIEGFF